MEELQALIKLATKHGASDVHLVSGAVPFFRIHGNLEAVRKSPLDAKKVEQYATNLLSQEQLKELKISGDVDTGVVIAGVSLRINIHRQSSGLAMAIRLIPKTIPTPEELTFSEIMYEIPKLESGLVVVSGPAGSGKSTTLATLVNMINQEQARHIITLEDPIEYRFTHQKSLIEQRQLGTDFPSFETGLRHVLRQDPNVIVVGEMRDLATISLALTAAETGHLVLSTVHAPNASEVVERLVTMFDGARQQQILIQLAATLKVVVSQQLVARQKQGLIAARETLVSTPAIQNAIRKNTLAAIRTAMQTGKRYGMTTMDQDMARLTKEGLI